MAQARQTIDIRAPRDLVFDAITDPGRTMEWNPNIVAMRDFTGYPVGVGSSWVQTATIAGRAVELQCRVARWQPPLMGELQITGGQRATVMTECADLNGVVRVVQTIDFQPPGGLLGSMAGRLIAQQIGRELGRTLQRQKEALEREAGTHDGSRTP